MINRSVHMDRFMNGTTGNIYREQRYNNNILQFIIFMSESRN